MDSLGATARPDCDNDYSILWHLQSELLVSTTLDMSLLDNSALFSRGR